jgi:hypothetical protein
MERYHDYDEHPDEEFKPEPADVPDLRKPSPEPRAEPAAETLKQPEVVNHGEASLIPEPRRLADARLNGDANDVGQLNAALGTLESTDVGKQIGQDIRDNNVGIKFGQTEQNAVAQFDPNTKEITLNESLRGADTSVLAAHLAHEGTHAQWDAQGKHNSINQEYHAFKNESDVWEQVKGDTEDPRCDDVSKLISMGEGNAKLIISRQKSYQDLPLY